MIPEIELVNKNKRTVQSTGESKNPSQVPGAGFNFTEAEIVERTAALNLIQRKSARKSPVTIPAELLERSIKHLDQLKRARS